MANHVSWLDMYSLNALDGWRFVAKSEVERWPLFRTIARGSGSMFIVRGNFRDAFRVKNEVTEVLKRGEKAAVFPEGTTTDGNRLLAFFPAILQAAIDADAIVQPVAIRYLDANGKATSAPAYYDEVSLVDSIRATVREPAIRAEITLCEPIFSHGWSRRELAQAARDRIADALGIPRYAGVYARFDPAVSRPRRFARLRRFRTATT